MVDLAGKFPLKNLEIIRAYLFGSQTSGLGNDFDLLVVSDDFEGVSRIKRAEKVKLNFVSKKIDPVCMTNSEFERLVRRESIFLKEILKNAILIYERSNY
jgi:predicted nucleotidyltransferase